jgi:hypothetical protein
LVIDEEDEEVGWLNRIGICREREEEKREEDPAEWRKAGVGNEWGMHGQRKGY